LSAASKKNDVNRRTISHLWKQAKELKACGSVWYIVDALKSGRCGRKKKYYSPNFETLLNVPLLIN
jgi:hypothetical protein